LNSFPISDLMPSIFAALSLHRNGAEIRNDAEIALPPSEEPLQFLRSLVSDECLSLGFAGFRSQVLGFKANEFLSMWLSESLSLFQSFKGCFNK